MSQLLDLRDLQLHPKSSGFEQCEGKFWISSWTGPGWVRDARRRRTSANRAGNGTVRSGTTSPRIRTGTAVDLTLPPLDTFSWTGRIKQHTKSGQYGEALRIYEEMRDIRVKQTSYTFVAALKACGGLRDLQFCKRIHDHVITSGLESDVFTGTMLVDVYAKCGSLVDARYVFEHLPHRDVVSWTAMILGYAQMEEGEVALQLYARMQQEGVIPNHRTFVVALKACSSLAGQEADVRRVRTKILEQARDIHSDVVMGGFESDVFVGTMLLDVYVKCNSMVEARDVFEKMPHRDVVCWTAIILGYAQMEEGKEALQLYKQMQQEGVVPNDRTFIGALKACCSLARIEETHKPVGNTCLEEVRSIHLVLLKRQLECDICVATTLVDVYAKCGSLVDARAVFEKMPRRDVITWNAMISGYANMNEGGEALRLYARMSQEAVVCNDRTFVGALKACSSLAASAGRNNADKKLCLDYVKDIHLAVAKRGFESDVFVGTMLVDVYAKCGSLVAARQVFDQLPHHNVVSWTAIILGYAEMDNGEMALQLYTRMQQEGVKPDQGTFIAALRACSSVGALEHGKKLHAQIQAHGLEADLVVGSSLVDFYTKCGRLLDAQGVFDGLQSKDVVAWNALLYGYAKDGDGQVAVQCYEAMLQQGIEPNDVTFSYLLMACCHGGFVEKGQQYFRVMVENYDIVPTVYHYCCMVDLLGRSGRLEEAETVLQTMPLKDDVVGWTSLLTACRSYGDIDRGKRCFDRLVCLEPENAVAYVLLGNIYANAGRWNDVYLVEGLRLSAKARKKPGKACIEVNNKVHEFTVGEDASDVASKLGSMNSKLKEDGGHEPHTQLVLKAVSEQKKEASLCGHAEKLALAYGLLNTSDGTTLLVTKNLRMCNDCHSSTKIMSRVEKREIVVRDARCVHRFVNGSCSCGDRH